MSPGFARFLDSWAFTLIELLVVIAIIGTLASFGAISYKRMLDRAKVTNAIADIRNISLEIEDYLSENGELPATLDDLGVELTSDPWGNPYQYLNFSISPPGKRRKDRFLVPINNTYDLYSMGPDGKSRPPFTAKASQDDIVRANDGGYIGPAANY